MINFCKMHALGNDFMVVNNERLDVNINHAAIPTLANRFLGVGFDQLLILKPSNQADIYCEIFNADGSPASQCGNGLRCVARFLHEKEIIKKDEFTIQTKSGIYKIMLTDYHHISVDMGKAKFIQLSTSIMLPDKSSVSASSLSVGNTHVIINVKEIHNQPLEMIATIVRNHEGFLHQSNVGLMQILSREEIKLRTHENGVGETFACGSNAVAAVTTGIKQGSLANHVKVLLRYGALSVMVLPTNNIILTGDASLVYEGRLALE